MARLDGTGPQGLGPRTGWGRGPCCGYGGFGGGGGYGRGGGFGLRRKVWTQKDERGALDEEEKMLKEELKAIQEERDALKD